MARILIVEDDRLAAAALARLLEDLGHDILRAHSVHEAREAGVVGVDLLVSDLSLPDGRGEQLAAELGVPAIALSGFDAPQDRERSRAAGFSLHLVKPIEFEQLEAAVERLLAGPEPGTRT